MLTANELAKLPQVPLARAFICCDCETISTCPTQCPACANEYQITPLKNFFHRPEQDEVLKALDTKDKRPNDVESLLKEGNDADGKGKV